MFLPTSQCPPCTEAVGPVKVLTVSTVKPCSLALVDGAQHVHASEPHMDSRQVSSFCASGRQATRLGSARVCLVNLAQPPGRMGRKGLWLTALSPCFSPHTQGTANCL